MIVFYAMGELTFTSKKYAQVFFSAVISIDENIARGKPAMMISTHINDYAAHGVDGNFHTNNYFHTNTADRAWWAVDLGEGRARVTRVKIVNREAVNWGK